MPPNGQFQYACFISYKHPPKWAQEQHFYSGFARALQERLEFYLSSHIRTFLDVNADPGTSYPITLSQALCKSVCMVALLTPEYLDSAWCLAEWKAMEAFEKTRLGPNERGLIIPVAIRRSAAEWNNRLQRKPVDFTKVSVPDAQLKNIRNSAEIQRIAVTISQYVNSVSGPCNCSDFMLQVGEDLVSSPPSMPDPDPFAS